MAPQVESTFEGLADRLRAAAKDAGAFVVEALPTADGRLGPVVVLDPPDALRMVAAIKPRIVYLIEDTYDIEGHFEEMLAPLSGHENGREVDHALAAKLDQLRRRTIKYDGQVYVVAFAFMVDGVLHTGSTSPEWFDVLEGDLEQLIGEERQRLEDASAALDEHESEEIKQKAEILASHPAFSVGRVSFVKRCLLAEHLFPDLQSDLIGRITARAEKVDWLAKALE